MSTDKRDFKFGEHYWSLGCEDMSYNYSIQRINQDGSRFPWRLCVWQEIEGPGHNINFVGQVDEADVNERRLLVSRGTKNVYLEIDTAPVDVQRIFNTFLAKLVEREYGGK